MGRKKSKNSKKRKNNQNAAEVSVPLEKTVQPKQKNRRALSALSKFSCKVLEISSTNIIPSNNEVTSSLKRPLHNNLDFNEKIKKFRESREDKSSLNNKKGIEEHHISLLIEKLDKIVKSDKINGNKHHVSDESNSGSREKDICINDAINSDSNNEEICSSKVSVSKEGSQNIEKKSNNVSNDINNCVSQVKKMNTESTNNDDIQNDYQLIRLSSSGNSKDKDVDGEDIDIVKIIDSSKNHPDIENNDQLIRPSSSENKAENSKDKDVDFPLIKNIESINVIDSIENNHQLIRLSSSENIAVAEKSKDKDVDFPLIKNIESINDKDNIENNHQLIRPTSSENIAVAEKSKDKDVDFPLIKNIESINDKDNIENNHQLIRPSSSENKAEKSKDNDFDFPLNKNIESINDKDSIESNHQLIRPSSSENIAVAEKSKDNDFDFPLIKNNDLQLCNDNIVPISTKSTNGIDIIANDPENNNNEVENEISNLNGDKNGEMIESDTGSTVVDNFNGSNTDKESDSEDEVSKEDTTPQNTKSLATSVLFELFSEKDNLSERWGSFVKFKCIEYLTDKDVRGRERREAEYTQRIQKMWIEKFSVLLKTLSNYEVLVKNHVAQLSNVPKQIKTCRSVALQADFYSLEGKDSFVKLQNQVQQKQLKLNQPLPHSDCSPVDISSDDDDDVVLVEPTTTPSSSKTEINTKAKKHSSTFRSISSSIPSTSKKFMASTTKAVPPAIPIISNVINTDSIDLTGNDEVPRIHFDNVLKPFKIIRYSRMNNGSSRELARTVSTQASSKNLTFIESSQLPTSSHYVVKKSAATVSNQLTGASNQKTVSIEPNSSLQSIVIKPSRKFLHFSPVVDPNQPSTSAATFTSRQINHLASQLIPQIIKPQPTKSQLIKSPITMVQSTMSQLAMAQSPRPQLAIAQSTVRPQFTVVQSTTRPKIAVIQSTRPQFTMVQSTKPQQNRPLLLPVPPAIPLKITHPAPLPPVPNQTSLPSWKKLPSAPVLTVSEKRRGEVLLSWVVPRYTRPSVSTIITYQIFAYNVSAEEIPQTSQWILVGTADALPLPMACTISQLQRPQVYYFAVRAVDIHTRVGPFSLPKMLNLS